MDRLERDGDRRAVLASSWNIHEAAVDEGIVDRGAIDLFACCMQDLYDERLIAFRNRNAGTIPSPVWDGNEIQQMHQWRVTADGRRDAALFREATRNETRTETPSPAPPGDFEVRGDGADAVAYDVFISHASEDKDAVARPLAAALETRGWTTWLDELQLTVGDSLAGQIDHALSRSRFGVVILSQAFFSKPWPQRELAGLTAREVQGGSKVILPVWHEIDREAIASFSPPLADKLAASTALGIDHVAGELARALTVARDRGPGAGAKEAVLQAVPLSGPEVVEDETGGTMSSSVATKIALASVLIDKGDSLAAEAYLQEAVEAGDSHAMLLLGMTLKDLGRLDEAVSLLSKAVDVGRSEALTPLGIVLHELGRLDEAERVLRQAASAQ